MTEKNPSNLKLKTFFENANDLLDQRDADAAEMAARQDALSKERRLRAAKAWRQNAALKKNQTGIYKQYLKDGLESLAKMKTRGGKKIFEVALNPDAQSYSTCLGRDAPALEIELRHVESDRTVTVMLLNENFANISFDGGRSRYYSTPREALKDMAKSALAWAPKEVEQLARKQNKPKPRAPGR